MGSQLGLPIRLSQSFIDWRMFLSRLGIHSLGKGAKHLLIRAVVAGNRLFATSSKAKSTEQLDIDKKNGALAYVPFTTDFEITPLAGKIFVIVIILCR
jgi:DNA-directed RNA polymerase